MGISSTRSKIATASCATETAPETSIRFLREQETQLNCTSAIHEISSYIDGELEASVRIELEEHLQECEGCAIIVRQTQLTVEIFCNDKPGGITDRRSPFALARKTEIQAPQIEVARPRTPTQSSNRSQFPLSSITGRNSETPGEVFMPSNQVVLVTGAKHRIRPAFHQKRWPAKGATPFSQRCATPRQQERKERGRNQKRWPTRNQLPIHILELDVTKGDSVRQGVHEGPQSIKCRPYRRGHSTTRFPVIGLTETIYPVEQAQTPVRHQLLWLRARPEPRRTSSDAQKQKSGLLLHIPAAVLGGLYFRHLGFTAPGKFALESLL